MSSGQSGKGTAAVTGASSGIGKVYAEELAKQGYDLLLVARRADRLEALKGQIEAAHGVKVESLVADLGKAQDLDRVAGQLRTDASITMLVNNAGTSKTKPLADTKWAEIEPMIQINVAALTALTMAVLPGFKERNQGTIINIGSVVGFHGFPGATAYSATKAYVLNFTRTLQAELAETGIRVQHVAPAATESEIWEIAGMARTALPPDSLMSTENCVRASLRGLEMGETATVPPLEDAEIIARYDAAGMELLQNVQTGKPASRYGLAG